MSQGTFFDVGSAYEELYENYMSGEIGRDFFIKTAVHSGVYKSRFKNVGQFAKGIGLRKSQVYYIVNGRGSSADHIEGAGVYFIQCHGFVKIGWSKNIGRRIECIKICNPHSVKLLLFDTSLVHSDEAKIHTQFREFRKRGEWFVLSDEIKSFISLRAAAVGKQLLEMHI